MEIPIQNEDLAKLNQDEAVDLVRNLVQVDAKESDISPNKISFPSVINAPDGGIDGKVDGVDKDSKQGTIKKGLTCYQIKTGDYRIDQQGIKKLFGDKDDLKPEIENCLKNGTLVIVLTGQDLPTDAEKGKIYEYLGWKPSIEIWAQNTLIGYLKRYPKLCLLTLKRQDNSFNFYDDWADQEDMSHDLVTGKKQDDFIADLRQRLQSETLTEHIRVTGGHGTGKTRLVLEALRSKDLSRLCIYTRDPGRFMESKFFKYLAVLGDHYRAILVVDECPDEYMVDIWSQVSKHNNRIQLVTIYDIPSQPRHNMKCLEIPTLDDMQIKQILESYVGPHDRADIWYKECESSPRAAHIIGKNLRSNPDNILRQSDTSGWDSFIAYRNSTTNIEFEKRKTILLWISQLQWFGYDGSYLGERKIVEDKIKKHEGIEQGGFAKTVKDLIDMGILRGSDTGYKTRKLFTPEPLIDMGILRGSDTLYVTPRALHVWLWREWYRTYGDLLKPFPLDDMWEKAQTDRAYNNVLKWHVDMWKYDEADGPHNRLKDVFKPNGFADRHHLLDSYFGADILYKMAKTSPKDAVNYLERYVNTLGMAGLQQFRAGRQPAASIMAEAAGCRNLFRRAAQVLLLLAGPGSQEADGVDNMFIRLFLPAAGLVSWTETPLVKRVPILREALNHKIPECRLVGIKACGAALKTKNFSKDIVDNEAWQRNVIWMPKSRIDYVEYYHKILDVIQTSLESLNEEERLQLAKVVQRHTRDLLEAPELHDVVLTLLGEMHSEQYVDSELIIETISDCLFYGRDDISEDLRNRLCRLHDEVVGDDYRDQMRRYVAMSVAGDFQIPDETRQETMAKLAKWSLNDPQAFGQELAWLVTDKAMYGYTFGHTLGTMDDMTLFANICDAQRQCVKSNAVFFGGYLRAVFDMDRGEWERLMHSLVTDPVLNVLVPTLTSLSGMTDKIATSILELVKSKVDPLTLKKFTVGQFVRDVPEAVFQKWWGLLIDGSDDAYSVALNLYCQYYVHGKKRIPDSVNSLLFPQNDSRRIRRHSGQTSFIWSEILGSYVGQGHVIEDTVQNVVDVVIAEGSYRMLDVELMPALVDTVKHHPSKTWEAISALIDPAKTPSVRMLWNVRRAFSTNKELVEKITLATIHGWIDEDVERRAKSMAFLLPHDIMAAAEYTAKYGEVNGVKDALINNLLTETFGGPYLEHYEGKIKAVDSLLATDDRSIIREFLEEFRDALSEKCDRI